MCWKCRVVERFYKRHGFISSLNDFQSGGDKSNIFAIIFGICEDVLEKIHFGKLLDRIFLFEKCSK